MSNQLQITGGAKVRNLEGVLTGTSGVVNALGINVPSGIPQLDSNGKILVSQLPNSVMEYKGTWNAATNTPTLVNGTGNQGDVYLCSVAGTVNFGAGAITFAVGDQVIYSGTIWQKAGGSTGTVTSVSVTESGDALTITGSPITTSGTINIGFAGTASQYVNGAGGLTTFPSLTGYVPYTGATTDVDLGAHVLNAQALHVKGTAGAGHLGLKHQSTAATGSASESLIYANVDGDLAWQNDNLYLTTLSTHANTANRVYTFPDASGTIALTSDISYPVTSVFGRTGAVTAQSGDYTTTQVTEGTNLYFTDARARGAISLTTTGTSGAATYNSTTGVLNVPNYGSALSGYVPYTGATTNLNLGSTNSISALKINLYNGSTYTSILGDPNGITIGFGSYGNSFYFDNANNTYTFPNASGTIALTSNLSSYVTLGTSQTITGSKTFNAYILSSAGGGNQATIVANISTLHSGSSGVNGFGFNVNNNIYFGKGLDNGGVFSWNNTTVRYYTLPDATGTIALTSDIPSLSGYVQGSGTTNYLPKFTASGTIGNSSIIDDGTIRAYTNALYVFQTGGTGAAFYMSGGGTDSALSSITSSSTYQNLNLLASTLAFYTGTLGGLSTTERMRITPSGNVGIGTTSPNTYTIAPQLVVDSGASGGGLTIKTGTTSSTTNYGGVFFADGTTGSEQYRGFIQYSHNFNSLTDTLILGTAGTEKMYITSGGNVGIGVTPSTGGLGGYSLLEIANGGTSIYSGANQTILGTNISWSGGSATYKISNYAEAYIQQSGTHQFLIAQNGTAGNPITFTTAMYITSGGNVGIGTTSPARQLEIYNANDAFMKFNGARVGNAAITIGTEAAGFVVYDDTNSAYRLVIKQNGNVGIGTISPTSFGGGYRTLGVSGSTSTEGGIFHSMLNGTSAVYMGSNSAQCFIHEPRNVYMTFGTNDTERMRITSGGQLFVRTTTQLSPGGVIGVANILNPDNNGQWALAIQNNATTNSYGRGLGIRIDTVFNNASNEMLYCADSLNSRFYVMSNGGVYNYQANNVNLSDINTKKDITPCESYWDKFKAIEIVKFKYKDQTHDDFNIGVIAQQVEEFAPEFIDTSMQQIDGEEKETKAVYTSDLHHATIKVLQEAMAKIEELSAKVTALENNLN